MRHITLLTDFGTTEGEHTVLKGVIWNILPGHPIADLSHSVSPQNIQEAALILERTAHYFPDETVHIVVVDPGVGTVRKPVAARFGAQFFVGPDNGVCTPLLERAEEENAPVEIVHLDKPQFWLDEVSPIFHGRDIFAPCGAHLASGVPLEMMGTPLPEIVRFHLPEPIKEPGILHGEVIHIDHFGNLITNLRRDVVEDLRPVRTQIKDVTIEGLSNTFGDRRIGELVAVYSPNNYLMISVVNGNASERLAVPVGERVKIAESGKLV